MRKRRSNPPPEFKIGVVRYYAVHIRKEELGAWEQKGFVAGGRPAIVPMPPDKVWVWGIPQTLADTGIERLIGRKVDGFSTSLGSYGMGGMGLWGVRLAPNEDAEFGEYLAFPISNSGYYRSINGAPPTYETAQALIGSSIDSVTLTERQCDLRLKQKGESHILSLYLDSPYKDFYFDETAQIADYLIFQDRRGMLTS
jgi:hypothetical protein